MDLEKVFDAYDPDQGAVLELKGPDGSPLLHDDNKPMTITVVGQDSAVWRSNQKKLLDKALARRPGERTTAAALEADDIAALAKATVDWNITLGGAKPKFSTEAAKQLYSNPKARFIVDQIDRFILERGNFLKASPNS